MTKEEAREWFKTRMDSGLMPGTREAYKAALSALTPPNEPLELISMEDELPPDNERVLVYRPCMADADLGPYSVQWGWAAKKDGSHWAYLPSRAERKQNEENRN